MRCKQVLFLFILVLFSKQSIIAQLLMEEAYKNQFIDNSQSKLVSWKIVKEGDNIVKTIEFEVKDEGNYSVYIWAIGNKNLTEINISIDNDVFTIFENDISENKWHFLKIIDKEKNKESFYFDKGVNQVSFTTSIPNIPQIEFIVLSDAPTTPSPYYDGYSESPPFESIPAYDYNYRMNIMYSYTYWTTFYFYSGTQVTLETKKSNPYGSDPVMYLFYGSNPANGSWANDNGGSGYQSKIQITAPYSGVYYTIIRSKNPNANQTSDLWFNNSLYISNISISGYYTASVHSLTDELNYFTSHSTGDPRLWIECYNSTHNRILWLNDNYEGPGDYDWGVNARIKKAFSSSNYVTGMLVTSSSYYPTGRCDLYLRCKNASYDPYYFPNLQADDAIQSSGATLTYNCYAWAGGITNEWIEPDDHYAWEAETIQESFVLYFGNNPPRYYGAMNYTRNGANSGNSIVDVYGYKDAGGNIYSFRHAVVRKPGNNHIHGYDWESKAGGLSRFFHPRNACEGGPYGQVVNYYRWDGTYAVVEENGFIAYMSGKGLSFEESIANGLTVLEDIEFDDEELKKIEDGILQVQTEIIKKMDFCIASINNSLQSSSIISKDYIYKISSFKSLNEDSKKIGVQILPYLMLKFAEGNIFCKYVIKDISLSLYADEWEITCKEMKKIRFTADKKYIAPSERAFWIHYFKEILRKTQKFEPLQKQLTSSIPINSNEFILSSYPNPFNNITTIKYSIPQQSHISLVIYDLLGKKVKTLIDNMRMESGNYSIHWDGTNGNGNFVSSGVYIYILNSNSNILSKKLILIK